MTELDRAAQAAERIGRVIAEAMDALGPVMVGIADGVATGLRAIEETLQELDDDRSGDDGEQPDAGMGPERAG